MANNLPDNLKTNWVDNETVMPVNVNGWSSAINKIKDAVPVYSANGNFYTATYGSNIYSLSPITMNGETNVPPSAYIDGMKVVFKCPTNNSANCSVNVNSLGNKAIKNLDGSNIGAGVLVAGNYIELIYDNSQGYFKLLTAHYLPISSVAGKGSASLPVYFDADGKAQPITSYQGNSATATKATQDANGDVIDVTYAKNENLFDKMNQSKAMETGSVSYVEEVLQDVIKYKNSSFDFSKFVKVGNPTITDDGIISGTLNASNCLKVPMTTGNYTDLEIGFNFVFKTSGTYIVKLADFGSFYQIYLGVNGTMVFEIPTMENGSSVIKTVNVLSNTWTVGTEYKVRLTTKDLKIICFVTNLSTGVERSGYIDLVDPLNIRSAFPNALQLYNVQSADYKKAYIKINGEEVFNGHQEGIDVLKPNDFIVGVKLLAFIFDTHKVYADDGSTPTELYNADGSYYLGTDFSIINDKVIYPEQATRGTDDITIEGVTYYEFEHSSTNIYTDDPTTPTALFNSDGSEYTGTQWNIMSSKVYYLNEATYTSAQDVYIERVNGTMDAGVKISDKGILTGAKSFRYHGDFKQGPGFMTGLTLSSLANHSWSIESSIKQMPVTSDTQFLMIIGEQWDNWGSIAYFPSAGSLRFNAKTGDAQDYSGEGSKIAVGVKTYLHEIHAKLTFDITTGTYSLYHKENINDDWILGGSYTATTTNKQLYYINSSPSWHIILGSGSYLGLKGAIDLNNFKVYVDEKLIYQPMLKIPYIQSSSKYGSKVVKEEYRNRVEDAYEQGFEQKYFTLQENDKENFIIDGTPSITDNGIVSNLSLNNYITIRNKLNINALNWKFKFRFKINTIGQGFILIGDSPYTNKPFGLYIQSNGHINPRLFVNINGEAVNYFNDADDYFIVQEGKTYDYYFERNGNDITIGMKEVGISTYSTHTRTYGNYPLYSNTNNDITLYHDAGSYEYYLKELFIIVDNKIVYTPYKKPNFTLPLGELYGLIESKVPKTSLSEVICIVEDYTYEDASAFCWDLSNGIRIQGATQTVTSFGIQTIPLLKNFANDNYIAFKNYHAGVNTAMQDSEGSIFDKTTSSFKTSNASGDTTKFDWIAIGKIG